MKIQQRALVMSKEQRQRAGIFNQAEVCRMAGITGALMNYYCKLGRIPYPSHPLGNRLYYTSKVARKIVRYFETRPKGKNEPDIFPAKQK